MYTQIAPNKMLPQLNVNHRMAFMAPLANHAALNHVPLSPGPHH